MVMKDIIIKQLSLPLLAVAFTLLFTGCSDDTTGPGEIEAQLQVHTAKDIPANPDDGGGGPPGAHTNFTYYSLTKGKVVADADSDTIKWDIAFSGLTILTNSGVSGPGEGGAVILDQSFIETTTAPKTGYTVDSDTLKGAADWYNYDTEE